MNELSTAMKQLPDNLEDLSRFVIVHREELNAIRAQIRAIDKVGLAKEVHEQKLHEAQEIADAVLDAEVRIGELTRQMEKAQGFASIRPTDGENVKTKTEQLAELGIKHPERFETLANHPETVKKAKEEARAEGRIVTRADVLNRIAPPQNHRQTINQIKKQARENHEAFQEAKKDSVVTMEEIKQDKTNREIITLDVLQQIRKIPDATSNVDLLKSQEIKQALSDMTRLGRSDLLTQLRNSAKTITHLMKLIGEIT